MTQTSVTSKIGKQDIKPWDGVNSTYTRRTSSGGALTLNSIDYFGVDILFAYGAGSTYTKTTVDLALKDIGTTNLVSIWFAPGTWIFDATADYSAYDNVTFVVPPGASLEPATGTTLTIPALQAGPYHIFGGAGTVALTNTFLVYPEWWGAVADSTVAGDGTDSGVAIQAAFDAAPTGATIKLRSGPNAAYYSTTGIEIVGGSADSEVDTTSKRLTVQGEATIYFALTGVAFKVMSRTTRVIDIQLQATTASKRSAVTQVGLEIANQTGSWYQGLRVKDFYTNYKLFVYSDGQDPTWLETTKFFSCWASGGQYGWYIATDKLIPPWQSFATLEWFGCAVDINYDADDYAVGVYIGKNVDLYRGYMDMSVHNKGNLCRGFEYHGKTHGFTGRWQGEAHANNPLAAGNTGQTLIYIAEDADRLEGNIEVEIMGVPIPMARESAATIAPNCFYEMSNKGKTFLTWEGKDATPWSIAGAEFLTILTDYVTDAVSSGTETIITCSAAPGFVIGHHSVMWGIDPDDNPFYDFLEWESFVVTDVSLDGLTITIDIDTSEVVGSWLVGDVASLRRSTVQFEMGVTDLGYVQFRAPGGRFSFLQSNDDQFSHNVAMIPVVTPHWSSDIGLNEAEPDVSGIASLMLDNTLATTITDFAAVDFGNPMGRLLFVRHMNDNTAMTSSYKLQLLGGKDVQGQTDMAHIFLVMDNAKGDPTTACTFTDSGDLVGDVAHGLSNGDKVIFTSIVTTTGISEDTIYYVVGKTDDTFQVAATKGGTALPLTTNGTGTYYAQQAPTNWYWYEIYRSYGCNIQGNFAGAPSVDVAQVGQMYMCTGEGADNLEKPIFFNGTKWITAAGADAAT